MSDSRNPGSLRRKWYDNAEQTLAVLDVTPAIVHPFGAE